jgi:hypothetical protein
MPGVLAVQAPPFVSANRTQQEVEELGRQHLPALEGLPLLVLCDDAEFVARSVNNFVWVTFTRSNPSHDVHGIDSFVEHKHWGCRGPSSSTRGPSRTTRRRWSGTPRSSGASTRWASVAGRCMASSEAAVRQLLLAAGRRGILRRCSSRSADMSLLGSNESLEDHC